MRQGVLELRMSEVQVDSPTGLYRGTDANLDHVNGGGSNDVVLFMSDSLQIMARFRLRIVKSAGALTNGGASRFHIRYLCKQNGKTGRILMACNFAGR